MKIKELRQLTGLSQTQFAKKFHIPANTVRGWEQEKRSPPEYVPEMIEEIIRIEQAPIRGQQEIKYKPLTDDDILNDDAAAAEPKPKQKTEPEPQQQQPQEEINTDTVKKEIFKKINEYLESKDFDGIKCIDCIHDRNNCDDYFCEWKNYKYYKEYKKIIEEEINK